jgi:hypothetical protein
LINKRSDIADILRPLGPTPWLLKGKVYTRKGGREIIYEQIGFENNLKYLQFILDLLSDLADAYPVIVALGEEAVPYLQSYATRKDGRVLRNVARELLLDIENRRKD